MPDTEPKLKSQFASKAPSITFDADEFIQALEDADWSDEEKQEYLQLLWSIVCEFVALGWGTHPLQQTKNSCGKPSNFLDRSLCEDSGVLDHDNTKLIEEFVRRGEAVLERSIEGGTDG